MQSPTPSTPSLPSSASTIGEYVDARSTRSPTPPGKLEGKDDPFDNSSVDSDDGDDTGGPARAPPNPFQKTLETMEKSGKDTSTRLSNTMGSPGRASMDVEAFKRLLMTGNASVAASASQGVTHDGASSTDTSSISRQSMFDAIQDTHQETPRTSHELSEREDDAHRFSIDLPSGRRKPPPPSSKHGKLIKVELRDDLSVPDKISTPMPGSSPSNQSFNRSVTDLNKPLPPEPRRSYDSGRDSIFDMESAGKTPEPPSPVDVKRRSVPFPIPPRRHSQIVSESRLSQEPGRISPKEEDDRLSLADVEPGRPRSNSGKAPPPPPTRRSNSVRASPHVGSTPNQFTPHPPPARSSSKRSATKVPPPPAPERRSSFNPPPPPPPRGRNSEDSYISPTSSIRVSGEHTRQSMESGRKTSSDLTMPSMGRIDSGLSIGSTSGSGGTDILADLSNLQKEIDELRVREEG